MDCIPKNVQCHTLPIGHRIRCDETAYQKMWNVTHTLLIIGQDVMSVPGRISTHILSVTRWDLMSTILWKKQAAYCLWNGIMRWMIRMKCSVTNFLLAMTWNFLGHEVLQQKKSCHWLPIFIVSWWNQQGYVQSLTFYQSQRWYENGWDGAYLVLLTA